MRTGDLTPSASGKAHIGTVSDIYASGVFDKISTVSASFDSEYNNGNSGSAAVIVWPSGNKQSIMLTDACDITFVAPLGPSNLVLKVIQDAGGSNTIDWTAIPVLWPAATAPTLTAAGDSVDVITFYCDGTNYYGAGIMDFR